MCYVWRGCQLGTNPLRSQLRHRSRTPITTENDDYQIFKDALYEVLSNLTRMLAKDGEGASKLLECTCAGAPDLDTAIIVAKSVIRSPLLKCAMFGVDANWGRIL